jgi:DNA polymerase III subunit gamma/tau
MAKRKPAAPVAPEAAPLPQDYTVLARRYRPQQFADVVGQEAVTRALVNALQSNRVAHAYLFTGARGVGKTSTARILAKALNCQNGPTATPCDTCEICHSIATGEDVDVLEIDGASNRGIDEVREIRQNVQYRPQRARYKIYIIDEVHMLTKEAFNALLKTLEEPPPHVKFIFATTEAQRIPATILSRCQRFDFRGISTSRILAQLRLVAAGEGVQADDEALELVARRAGGSMRDAQSLLDQLLAFGSESAEARLTAEAVQRLLGLAHDDRVAALVAAILGRDPKQALELLDQAVEDGLQLGELLDQLIDYWRDLMVVNCAGQQAPNLSVPGRYRETLAQQAKALSLDTALAGLDILTAAKARMRGSSHGRVLLEAALIRLGRLTDLVSLSQLAQWLNNGAGQRGGESTAPLPKEGTVKEKTAAPAAPRPPEPPEGEKKNPARPPDGAPAPGTLVLTEATLPRVWQEVLAQTGGFLARDLEKAASVAISGPKTLVLRFAPGYNQEREHCQAPGSQARMEDALRKITGHSWSVRVESASSAAAARPAPAAATETLPSRYRRQRTEALQAPLVKRAFELLGAQFVHVDDGFGTAPGAAVQRGGLAEPEPEE